MPAWTCSECNAVATWHYMPHPSSEDRDAWRCDEHVPRGCSCNTGDYFDECGRPRPCCEWDWSLEGYEKDGG
jgi:hypothetical protein